MPSGMSTASATGSGAATTVRISTVVAASVMTTVRITPTRSATTPHTNLPVAPPANTSANASPTPPTPRPLAIRMNGMKVRKPVRVALSIMPIAQSAPKPRPSRMPQPGAGDEQQHEERGKAAGPARRDEAQRRHRGAEGQDPPLTDALGEEACRDLERRHAAGVRGADEADLREREAELARPQRQEDVERLREAVMQEVDGGRGEEHRAGSGLHGPIIPGPAPSFK